MIIIPGHILTQFHKIPTKTKLLKPLLTKDTMLVTNIISFMHNVSNLSRTNYKISVRKCHQTLLLDYTYNLEPPEIMNGSREVVSFKIYSRTSRKFYSPTFNNFHQIVEKGKIVRFLTVNCRFFPHICFLSSKKLLHLLPVLVLSV